MVTHQSNLEYLRTRNMSSIGMQKHNIRRAHSKLGVLISSRSRVTKSLESPNFVKERDNSEDGLKAQRMGPKLGLGNGLRN